MAYLMRVFENDSEVVTIPNPLTLSGALNIRGAFTVGQLDADPTAQLYIKGSLKLHAHALTSDYAFQLRTETNEATSNFFGMDCEVHSMISRTADTVRALSLCGRVKAGTTISGAADMHVGYFLLDVDGTLNSSGIFTPLVGKVDAGGTFTAVGHLCSLWLDTLQSGPVGGSHQLVYMTNNGNCKLDQAFYMYGGTAAQGIAALFEFEACTGAQNFLGDKVDADIAFAHYRKVACTVDGVAAWIVLGLDA